MVKHRRKQNTSTSAKLDYRAGLRRDWSVKRITIENIPIVVLRTWLLLIVLVLPWYFGFVTWQAQCWLIYAVIPLPIFIAVGSVLCWFENGSTTKAPFLAYLLLAIATLGLFQSVRFFGSGSWEPNSVTLQRWMLEETASIDGSLFSSESKSAIEFVKKVAPKIVSSGESQKAKLAVSVSPEKSLSAIGSLTVAAILCWSASIAFRNPASHIWLFVCLATNGVIMSCIGLYQAIGQSIPLMEQIREGTPYGTFVSRNSAGGFLNVCMAGTVGLICVAFASSTRRRADNRYKIQDESWLASTIGAIEDRLATIDSKQLTALVVLALIAAGVFASASRGATISMVAASLATIGISSRLSRTNASWIMGILVAIFSVALLVTLELDTRIRDRFGVVLEDGVARSYIWEAAYRAMRFYIGTGSGLGTFHLAALPFQDSFINGWYYHAENLIAEFFVESGWIGILIFLLGIGLLFRQITLVQRNAKKETKLPILLSATFLTISCLVHNSVDFSLLVPAVFAPVAILLGTLCSESFLIPSPRKEKGDVRSFSTTQSTSKSKLPDRETRRSSITTATNMAAEAASSNVVGNKRAFNSLYYGSLLLTIVYLTVSLIPMRELASAENFERRSANLSNGKTETETNDEESDLATDETSFVGESRIAETKRLRAEAEIDAFRKELLRVLSVSGPADWKSTDLTLFRIAVFQLEEKKRSDEIPELAGGAIQMERLEAARKIYGAARKQSPLDWRLLWGNLLVSSQTTKEEQLRSMAVLTAVTSNRPNLLFRMGLLANELHEQELRTELWSAALKAAPSMATKVALVLSESELDGEIDVSIFPDKPEVLESVSTRAFPKAKFPKTNDLIWKRIVEGAQKLSVEDANRWVWLAKSAKTANNEGLELEYLEKAASRQQFNLSIKQRMAVLLANRGEYERALLEIESCLLFNPNDPNLVRLQDQIKQMLESSQYK